METGRNLCLITYEEPRPTLFVIFRNNPEFQRALKNFQPKDDHIYGVMNLRDNVSLDAWEVDSVWAKSGYGPILYQMAMSKAGSAGLMACRNTSQLSAEAKRVWQQFFDGAGSSFADAVLADGNSRHREGYLAYKYIAKKPLNLSPFLSRGKLAIGRDPYGEKLTSFLEDATQLLTHQMRGIYDF